MHGDKSIACIAVARGGGSDPIRFAAAATARAPTAAATRCRTPDDAANSSTVAATIARRLRAARPCRPSDAARRLPACFRLRGAPIGVQHCRKS
jgi:hypothetical protein